MVDIQEMEPVSVTDLRNVLKLTLDVLISLVDRDWSVPAHGLDFSVWEAVEHLSDDMFAYASQLSGAVIGAPELTNVYAPIGYVRRSEQGPSLTIWCDPVAGNPGQLQVLAAMGGLLVSVVGAADPATRGWHSSGLSDPEGFTSMGIVELLAHLYDIVTTFDETFAAPAEVCWRVLKRLFPDRLDELKGTSRVEFDAWPTLLWATGRVPLGTHPVLNSWSWDGSVRK
jgi:hypothetical protein